MHRFVFKGRCVYVCGMLLGLVCACVMQGGAGLVDVWCFTVHVG